MPSFVIIVSHEINAPGPLSVIHELLKVFPRGMGLEPCETVLG